MANMDEEGDPYKQVLLEQLLDMKIKAKKKEVKNMKLHPPQSSRQDMIGAQKMGSLMDAMASPSNNKDFKSHSLKNS